ncbi:MAG: hypothetical protein IT186_25745 [Acidobacteria bacterium]|nr:hypothetical protein [Acidobacteriota bacterium]
MTAPNVNLSDEIRISLDYIAAKSHFTTGNDWAAANSNRLVIYSHRTDAASPSSNDGQWSLRLTDVGVPIEEEGPNSPITWDSATNITAGTPILSNTYYRLMFSGISDNRAAAVVDNVTISSFCQTPYLVPLLSKSFSPDPIPLGSTSVLTFLLTNPNTSTSPSRALSQVQFTDTLPAGVTVGTTTTPISICGGSLTTTAPSSIVFTGGTLAPYSIGPPVTGVCTIPVTVTGTISGTHTNTSGFISSYETGPNTGSSGYGSDTLTVLPALAPYISKTFDPGLIRNGSAYYSTLIFTITNPNLATNFDAGSVTFTDNLPSSTPGGYQLTVSSTNPPAADPLHDPPIPGTTYTDCSGGTVTVTPGTGTSVTLSGATLNMGQTCHVFVNVFSATGLATPGDLRYENESEPVSATITTPGSPPTVTTYTGNRASATLATIDASPSLAINKQIGPSASGPWTKALAVSSGTSVYFYFTVENTGDVALTNLDINDLESPDMTPGSCAPVNIGGTLQPGDVTYCVSAAYSVIADGVNTAQATGDYNASTVTSNQSSADYTLLPATPYNYGGLPVPSFPALSTNLRLYGGARNATCATYLGPVPTPPAISVESRTDGGPTADPNPFVAQSWWNGVTGNNTVAWAVGTDGGSLDVVGQCPSPPCFLNGWINWQQNGDFNDEGNQVFENYPITASGSFSLNRPVSIPASAVLTGTWYARFRLTDDVVAYPSPVGTGLCGEVEDYALDASVLTTPVTLAYFHVYGQGNRTRFEWSTASETGNVGFDIYAVSKDKRGLRKLTNRPVPSTSAGPVEPREYEFEASLDSDVAGFYLEDIDIRGQRKKHGPFEFGKPYGKKVSPAKTDWAGIGAGRDRNQRAQDALARAEIASGKRPLKAYLLVRSDGLYRVTYEALLAAGFDFGNVQADQLALLNKGVAVPIEVTPLSNPGSVGGADKKFGPGSAIHFYGRAEKSLYTYDNVYTLLVDKNSAARIVNDQTPPSLTGVIPASYLETVTVERARNYDELTPMSDPWYDTRMFTYTNTVSADFPITLDAIASSSGATLSATYYGVTSWPASPDHHMELRLNGQLVVDDFFDNRAIRNPSAQLPPGLIRDGVNTLTAVLPGDSGVEWDMLHVKNYSITYPRKFIARNGRLVFESDARLLRVEGLPSSNVSVYRISRGQVARLSGAQVQRSGNSFAVRFPGLPARSTYIVTTTEASLTPAFGVPSHSQGLTAGPAALLIISHPDFINDLGPLVSARQAEGLSVKVVSVKDVFGQYSEGVVDPAAIKQYIAQAASRMGTRYVLLVGGDTYDYRNDLGQGAIGFIPTLYSRTDDLVAFAPVDSLFGDIDGDQVPDIAVGRFPVRSSAELEAVLQKTLAYGQKSYGGTAVFASDAADPSTSFKAMSQGFISSMAAGWQVQQANIDDAGAAAARATLLSSLNSGVALVNFVGHSSDTRWTYNALFDRSDAGSLRNSGRPAFVSQFGCWNTYFVSPFYDSLSHAFLLSGNQGAAAVMGATALTEIESDQLLGSYLVPRMTTPGVRVGDAVVHAKKSIAAQGGAGRFKDVVLGWVLLGDPTLVIQR